MVWGGISLTARNDLAFTRNETVNAYRNKRKILQQHEVSFVHAAQIIINNLEEVEINTTAGPAHSPDLNLLEHLYAILGRRLKAELIKPNILHEVGERLMQVWIELDQNEIWRLILSRGRRCEAAVRGRGEHFFGPLRLLKDYLFRIFHFMFSILLQPEGLTKCYIY